MSDLLVIRANRSQKRAIRWKKIIFLYVFDRFWQFFTDFPIFYAQEQIAPVALTWTDVLYTEMVKMASRICTCLLADPVWLRVQWILGKHRMAVIQYCGKVRPKLWKTQKMKNYIIKLKIKISCTIITCGILAPGAGTPEILADVQVVPPVNKYNENIQHFIFIYI